MSFDTSFIKSTTSKAVVDATIEALSTGNYSLGSEPMGTVPTALGNVDIVMSSRVRGLSGTDEFGRPFSITTMEQDSPFHGSLEQRVALLDHIASLVR